MDTYLRIFAFVLGGFLFISIVTLMLKRKSTESTSLLWFLVAVAAIILGLFPQAIDYIAKVLHIGYPPIVIVIIAIAFLVTIVFYLSNKLADAHNKMSEMAIHVSLLERDVIELKKQMESLTEGEDDYNEVKERDFAYSSSL